MSIQEQIEALTQELNPFWNPERKLFWYFTHLTGIKQSDSQEFFQDADYASYNKAEVEEYADCYRRLKLYQLLGKKAEKEIPLSINKNVRDAVIFGTDFVATARSDTNGRAIRYVSTLITGTQCVLGGVWFAREEDRLEAIKICGIDKAFQEKCAKLGLGGA